MNIFEAVNTGNLEEVRKLIAAGAKVNVVEDNSLQSTPLHLATKKSEKAIIAQEKLKAKINNTVLDKEYIDSKINAAIKNNLLIIEELLNANVNVNAKDSYGYTPLYNAVSINAPYKVQSLLIKYNANVKITGKFNASLLHYVATDVNPDLIQLYLDNGLEINAIDNNSRTPLHEAAKKSKEPKVIKELLKQGADPHAVDNENLTPVHESLRFNNIHEIRELLISTIDDINESKLLHYAVNNSPDFKTIEMFVAAGADINLVDDDGNTPLHILAININNSFDDDDLNAVIALLENGADIDERNSAGKTPSETSSKVKELVEEYSISKYEKMDIALNKSQNDNSFRQQHRNIPNNDDKVKKTDIIPRI